METFTAVDSAPQKFVTVRQIFSAVPASSAQAAMLTSAVSPFLSAAACALPKSTDESRASISSDSIFFILTFSASFVNIKRMERNAPSFYFYLSSRK